MQLYLPGRLPLNGNIYVAGNFYSDSISFGNFTLSNYFYNPAWHDIFIFALDPNGNEIWANSINAQYNININGMSTGNNSDLLVIGDFQSPIIYIGNDSVAQIEGTDIYYAKFDASGSLSWLKGISGTGGGTSYDVGEGITSDEYGNIYITGEFHSDYIYFAGETLMNDSLNHSGAFVAKCGADGVILWGKNICSSNNYVYTKNIISNVSHDIYGYVPVFRGDINCL